MGREHRLNSRAVQVHSAASRQDVISGQRWGGDRDPGADRGPGASRPLAQQQAHGLEPEGQSQRVEVERLSSADQILCERLPSESGELPLCGLERAGSVPLGLELVHQPSRAGVLLVVGQPGGLRERLLESNLSQAPPPETSVSRREGATAPPAPLPASPSGRRGVIRVELSTRTAFATPGAAQRPRIQWSEEGRSMGATKDRCAAVIVAVLLMAACGSQPPPPTTSTEPAVSDPAPVADGQDDAVALHDLQLSEGPPESGFNFMDDLVTIVGEDVIIALPDGNVSLAPAFEPGVIAYSASVSQPILTIMARAATGMSMSATGTAAGGAALITVNQSGVGDMNEQGAFTSMTLSGLTPGENTIRISTSGQTYTVVVTREP